MLIDEELADLVWELWDLGLIEDALVTTIWLLIAISFETRPCRKDQFQETHRRPSGPGREP